MIYLVIKLLNMSISASWLVLAVILLRLLFRKAPKWISCLLWSIVALRLVIPFNFESAMSLIPSAEVIPQDIATTHTPAIYSGISAVNSTINPLFTQYLTLQNRTMDAVLSIVSEVWLAGVVILLLCSAVSYWRLRWQVRASIPMQSNLYVCDDVQSPFILGTIFPKIYIPSGIDEEHLRHVLAHENAHLKRMDHWWKPLGFLLLTVYWFNPLLWLAYILLCRDIERACDEKVIEKMDTPGKKAYAETLAACSVHRRLVMACPVAFGEISVKTRIVGILHYKKPAFWIILSAAAVCAVTAVCFLTDPIPCIHRYTGTITTTSTCTQNGIQTFTCSRCDHSYTAPADLLAHTYAPGDVLTEPSCTHPGSRELVCTGCGATKTEPIEKTDHTLGIPFLSKVPNCAETGEMSAACTLCHAVHLVQTVATNQDHDLKESVIAEASCAADGEGVITCSRCDYEERCTYEKLGHSFVEGNVIPGTCISFGIRIFVCTVCNAEYYEQLPMSNEHTWQTSGYQPTRCIHCGFIQPGSSSQQGNGNFYVWNYWYGSGWGYNPPYSGTSNSNGIPQSPTVGPWAETPYWPNNNRPSFPNG